MKLSVYNEEWYPPLIDPGGTVEREKSRHNLGSFFRGRHGLRGVSRKFSAELFKRMLATKPAPAELTAIHWQDRMISSGQKS